MFRRLCRYAFLILGAFMVLLAVALALSIELDASQVQARQVGRAHVAQAVSQLESGCLTCHDQVNGTPPIEQVAGGSINADWDHEQFAVQTPEISSETAPISLPSRDQLNTQLIKTGHRILNLPQVQSQRFETVIETYLHVYAQTSAAFDEDVTQWALWQLDGIENVLRGLENQASPYQMVRQDNESTPSSPAALYTLTTAPGVAMIVERVSVGNGMQMQFACLDVTQLAMPQEIVYATHRRGPPAGVVLDSVL